MPRRSALLLSAFLALPVASGGLAAAQSATPLASPSAAPPTEPALLVDDAATANPNLVESPLVVPQGFPVDPHTLRLPPGFTAAVVAAGLSAPRFMAFDAAGNLLVAEMGAGAIVRYPAADGVIAPAASPPAPLIDGLDIPSSLALTEIDGQTWLYVGQQTQVVRFPYDPNGALGPAEVVVPDLPAGGQHVTRTVALGPADDLYVAVGSSCNICQEADERRAAISRYDADGSGFELFARGLRNAVGLAIRPGTDELWATTNERDNQGDEIPPDLVTRVWPGANYGWPACQPPDATPQEPGADCSGVTPPTIGIQAHSAPLGLAFYSGDALGADVDGDLFVAQHGSWNRTDPAAPKLLRIDFDNGAPVAAADFATGWQDAAGDRWGRPVGIAVAPDGSLIVSDDQAGLLYRIAPAG